MPAPDMTDQYNTALPEKDETAFQSWATENNKQGDLNNYDLRGWWKKNGTTDERGHMTDEFKKPNHPTFSTGSQYHGVDEFEGGKWSGSEKSGWKYTPSSSNLKNMTSEELQDYFSKVEPGAELILPKAKKKTRGDKWYDGE